MQYEFIENTLIIINWLYKNNRLRDGEFLRFICTFNTKGGIYVHSADLEENNKGLNEPDGHFTLFVDAAEKEILPGRYPFEVLHLVNTGQSVSLISQDEGIIDITPSKVPEQKMYKTQELYSGLPCRIDDYNVLKNKPLINGKTLTGDTDINKIMFRRLLTSADDCDQLFEDGWYVYSTSSVPKNAPFPNASVIEVFGVDSTSTQKIQRAYRYGAPGYSAFRPLYSGAWSTWHYPLVTAANSNAAVTDYVVEQGISGKWTYRKWASGVAECWGTVTLTLSKDAYVWYGDIYCASGYGGSVLTSVFTSYTCVSIDPIYWYQIGGSGRVTSGGTLEANIFGKNTSMSSLKKDGQIDINCIVKGRWK